MSETTETELGSETESSAQPSSSERGSAEIQTETAIENVVQNNNSPTTVTTNNGSTVVENDQQETSTGTGPTQIQGRNINDEQLAAIL